MKCVKTGVKFQVPQFREDTFHGDLFWCNALGFYLIRGIPQGTSDYTPDLILSPADDAYSIDSIGDSLIRHFLEWTDQDIRNSVETVCVVIDDTRFL